jgi:hypothetical protein
MRAYTSKNQMCALEHAPQTDWGKNNFSFIKRDSKEALSKINRSTE